MVNHTRNKHRYTVFIIKLGCCIFQGQGNEVRITRTNQEKRYLMIATTMRDRTCQPTVVATYF
jgi:hypothetical protein